MFFFFLEFLDGRIGFVRLNFYVYLWEDLGSGSLLAFLMCILFDICVILVNLVIIIL